jgi:hypothetical protein
MTLAGSTACSIKSDCEQGCTPELFAGDPLFSHFLDSLLVRARQLRQFVKSGSTEDRILVDVHDEIAHFRARCNLRPDERKGSAWAEAYRIELLLLLAEPPERLIPELEYRLLIAEDIGVKGIAGLRAEFLNITNKDGENGLGGCSYIRMEDDLRFILIETVRKTQRFLIKKYLSRCFLRVVMRRIVCATLISFTFCIAMYMLMESDYHVVLNNNSAYAYTHIRIWGLCVPLLTCLSSGLFGSYFSRLLDFRKRSASFTYDELSSTKDMWAILFSGAVGVCGAALIYFLLRSGITSGVITGPLVPDIGGLHVEGDQLFIANKDLALLSVWGFFAGFSERLVPSILATTESRFVTTGTKIEHAAKRPLRHAAGETQVTRPSSVITVT